jgi:hypothetical protein
MVLWPVVGLLAVAGIVAGVGVWGLDRYVRQEQGLLGTPPAAQFAHLVGLEFDLPDIRTGERVTRSDPAGRPVVLFFGSFTCPRFFDKIPEIREMYERHQDQAAFRLVYIREPYHENPAFEEVLSRRTVITEEARICTGLDMYDIGFPCVRDTDGQRLENAYQAYPTRAYVIGRGGEVVWASQSGLTTPEGLDVRQTEAQLQGYLDRGQP